MANRTCSIEGCDLAHLARTWCATHYTRWRKTGSTDPPPASLSVDCSVSSCKKVAVKRGWCSGHYRRWISTGDVRADEPLRIINAPTVDGLRQCNGCRLWRDAAEYKNGEAKCLACRRLRQAAFQEANPNYWREWQRANPDKVSATVQMRRAARASVPREAVNRRVVFERDSYECQICNEPMDMSADRFDPRAPTVDHIVPLSRGGHHTYDNVQSACRRCNTAKGDRITVERKHHEQQHR